MLLERGFLQEDRRHIERGRVTPRSGRRRMSPRCLTECCVPLRLWKSVSLIPLDELHTAMWMDLQQDASGEPLQMFETLPLWRVYQSVMTRGRHPSCPGPAESFTTARCIGGHEVNEAMTCHIKPQICHRRWSRACSRQP